MLGCQDFCGYYEWTFHYVRRQWGQAAVARLWAEAIGGESQQHYAEAARQAGLAGLHQTWVKTGQDESCDWTFTLDASRNLLRWDMRQCPSKGFLSAHDLNADEDYCDHCMGWMIPLLEQVGVEVLEHEHNHYGQCWGSMRQKDRPSEALDVEGDIRRDPRWNCGYVERWEHNRKQPLMAGASDASDPCDVLAAWFARADRLIVVSEEADLHGLPDGLRGQAGLLTDRAYVAFGDLGLEPLGVLVGHAGADLNALANRYLGGAPAIASVSPGDRGEGGALPPGSRLLGGPARQAGDRRRPLLLHAYLPACPARDFLAHGLPRPLPILPLLIRRARYVHRPGGPYPSDSALLVALAEALDKPAILAGRSACRGA